MASILRAAATKQENRRALKKQQGVSAWMDNGNYLGLLTTLGLVFHVADAKNNLDDEILKRINELARPGLAEGTTLV